MYWDTLKREEKILFELRSLYARWGYRKYKMNKFEEYDFYVENKNFLACENIIAFNDMNGKLLALKPDVTLSIAKNTHAGEMGNQRLYYLENVYRLLRQDNEYREIHQMGLEFLGTVDLYSTAEVMHLALGSLGKIHEDFILEVSHMAFISGLMDSIDVSEDDRTRLLGCISAKNSHELKALASELGITNFHRDNLVRLTSLYGDYRETLEAARELVLNGEMRRALDELEDLYEILSSVKFAKNLQLDFSMAQDIYYYSGIIFKGYIRGIPQAILSGGRYDHLMKKFHKDVDALGFALYLNDLESYFKTPSVYDVDVLVLYDSKSDLRALADKLRGLVDKGLSLRVERKIPAELRFKRVYRFLRGDFEEVFDDAEYSPSQGASGEGSVRRSG